jgi:hypothetical protein
MGSNRRDTNPRLGSARGGPGIPVIHGREDVKYGEWWLTNQPDHADL